MGYQEFSQEYSQPLTGDGFPSRLPGMELSKATAITVASNDPIRDLLKAILDEANGRRRYLNRKVTSQALINGLVVALGGMQPHDRAEFVDSALWYIGNVEIGVMSEPLLASLKEGIENPPPSQPPPAPKPPKKPKA